MKINYSKVFFRIFTYQNGEAEAVTPEKIVVTIPHHSNDGGNYQLRVWNGAAFGGIHRGHVDSGTAKSTLLLDIENKTREDLVELANMLFPGRTYTISGRNIFGEQEDVDVWVSR